MMNSEKKNRIQKGFGHVFVWYESMFPFFYSLFCGSVLGSCEVSAYGDPAQYLECFNLAVLVIHNLAVHVPSLWLAVLLGCVVF